MRNRIRRPCIYAAYQVFGFPERRLKKMTHQKQELLMAAIVLAD
jgi:hypothetical protein